MNAFSPALSPELLLKRNFFELYPFDGGGCFINRELIGTIDDAEFTRKLLDEDALKDYGGIRDIDFLRFEHWKTIEKSCWINRMYFIVPMARQYRLTGDERLAQELRHILIRFALTYPAPQTQAEIVDLERRVLYSRDHDYNSNGPDFDGPADYQWFDFQPASRILHILTAMFFLKDSPSFSASDRELIDELVRIHARIINWAETGGNVLAPGNHQALRGTALLTAAYAFRDESEAKEWAQTAMTICEYHIMHDFLPDGMLIDLSPSYHFFETWISRDAFIMAQRLGLEFSPDAQERYRNVIAICMMLEQPDGRSTVVSDGYPLELSTFLETLPENAAETTASHYLPDAGMALWKRNGTFMLFDCAPLLEEFSHHHGGKQAVTLFMGGMPFLVDSGCCSYDDDDFSNWFKQPFAHSTLLANGKGDCILEGRYHWVGDSRPRLADWAGDSISSVICGNVPDWHGMTWKRTLDIAEGRLVITDDVSRQSPADLTFIFNLHPDVSVVLDGNTAVLTNGAVSLKAEFGAPAEITDGLNVQNFKKVPARQLRVQFPATAALKAVTSFTKL